MIKKFIISLFKSLFVSTLIVILLVLADFFFIHSSYLLPVRNSISVFLKRNVSMKIDQFSVDTNKKKSILMRINRDLPPDVLTLKSNEKLYGEIIKDDADYIIFKAVFGHSGYAERKINRKSILCLKKRAEYAPTINASESKFAEEYPEFFIYQDENKTVITNSSFFTVNKIGDTIEQFLSEMRNEFKDIVNPSDGRRTLIIVFNKQSEYQSFFVAHYGQASAQSGACYLLEEKALVLFNENIYSKYLKTFFRHEATHCFFHNYFFNTSRTFLWYNEGLAEFCSSEQIGNPLNSSIRLIKSSLNKVPATEQFFNENISFLGSNGHLNYALAWATTFYAMKKYRNAFFGYMIELNSLYGEIDKKEHEQIFKKHFQMSFDEFKKRSISFVIGYIN
jgi:hypothetical protein